MTDRGISFIFAALAGAGFSLWKDNNGAGLFVWATLVLIDMWVRI